MNNTNPKVDFFFNKAQRWQSEFKKLRSVILDCPVTEELKWGVPCYTVDGKNIILMHGFKEYCAVMFIKGALLKDTESILIAQTENVQSARHVRFTSMAEIEKVESILKAYILEAIEAEKAGLKVDFKKTEEFKFPEEFISRLDEIPGLQEAFESLTPGRQRAYLLYFSGAKQPKTREARIEKYVEKILAGKGLND